MDIAGVAPPVDDMGDVPVTEVTPPALGVVQLIVPAPFVESTWPLVPAVTGYVLPPALSVPVMVALPVVLVLPVTFTL
jgi:hypothetical protein